jgi:hypothetical protein
MKSFITGLVALPFLVGVASAHDPMGPPSAHRPIQLTAQQMDKVNGGHFELDVSNTSVVQISLFGRAFLTEPTGNSISCSTCFLLINSPTFAIGVSFAP